MIKEKREDGKSILALKARLNVLNEINSTFETFLLCGRQTNFDDSGIPAQLKNCNHEKKTALHLAAVGGDEQSVYALLAFKADVNAVDKDQNPPLQVAKGGCAKILSRMVSKAVSRVDGLLDAAHPRNEASLTGELQDYNWTALMVAAQLGLTGQVNTLLKGGADILERNSRQQTALHLAAHAGHADAIEILVKGKADLEATDIGDRTALCTAAQQGNAEAVRALVDARANIEVVCKIDELSTKSVLDLANGGDCADFLKNAGIDGWTSLMVAVEKGAYLVEQYLKSRECILSIQAKTEFPGWFQTDLVHYMALEHKISSWTWGQHEAQNLVISEDRLEIVKEKDDPDYSCVLGSELFVEGVHRWMIQVRNVRNMWIGVARGVEGQQQLGTRPSKKTCNSGYILAFGPNLTDYIFYGDEIPDLSFLSHQVEYTSGSRVEFELDVYERSLKIWINEILTVIASRISGGGLYPFACMDCSESITLISRSSYLKASNLPNLHEQCLAGLDNLHWDQELDSVLARLIANHSLPHRNRRPTGEGMS